jgi:hypothetical protein
MYQAQDTATIFIVIDNPDALNPSHDRYSPACITSPSTPITAPKGIVSINDW